MNLEELKKINSMFLYDHAIVESDVEMVNKYIDIIEKTRDNKVPKIGDIVKYTDEHGDFYANALIVEETDRYEGNKEGIYEICEQPYVPFITKTSDNGVRLSCSGGAFKTGIKLEQFKLLGKGKRTFCDWGSCGACANGAIDFEAEVNVWELKLENRFGEYTTEKYDKLYITFRDEPTDFGYTVLASHGGCSYKAWENKKEYEIFKKAMKGVEFAGYWGENNKILFVYKRHSYYISKEDWKKMELPVDTRLCNGSYIPVKVKYDDENKIIEEYRYTNSVAKDEQIANCEFILERGI